MTSEWKGFLFTCFFAAWAGLCLAQDREATCVLEGGSGDPIISVSGLVKFKQSGANDVTVEGNIRGLAEGKEYSWDIYSQGSLAARCMGAGQRFNPTNKPSSPMPTLASSISGSVGSAFSLATGSSNSILGRTLVVNQGSIRVACCVVMLAPIVEAECVIESNSGSSTKTSGTVVLSQSSAGGPTTLSLDLQFDANDQERYHGFHIHGTGALGNSCKDAGGHYNPLTVNHGGPLDSVRHHGDLGNVEENAQGQVKLTFNDRLVQLQGEFSVLGRAIVVHATQDDLGKVNNEGSRKTGNAGGRLGCCIIMRRPIRRASCNVDAASGVPGQAIQGTVAMSQSAYGGPTTFSVDLSGFSNTDAFVDHGFHVHDKGLLDNQCKAAGGHYNPQSVVHGAPTSAVRHVGDLGNLKEDDRGFMRTVISDRITSLTGDQKIIDRSIVIHEKMDDLGLGGNEGSTKTGNAGSRLGCCLIKESNQSSGARNSYPATVVLIAIALVTYLFS